MLRRLAKQAVIGHGDLLMESGSCVVIWKGENVKDFSLACRGD